VAKAAILTTRASAPGVMEEKLPFMCKFFPQQRTT
jgi:hypothetical protein